LNQDPVKARKNLKKHGVSFTAAARVFADRLRIEWLDTREDYGEDRYVTVGRVKAEVLAVAYTMHGDLIRTISARLASPQEKEEYHGSRPI
jgi:uncharacterized DUF497 family protein